MATAKKLDDVTECSICTEVYTDPRVLPCGHVFCFKCIEAWSNQKLQQRNLACPLCRTEFSLPLPSIEIDERKRNFIALKFSQLEMKLKGVTVFIPPYGIMAVFSLLCLFVCLFVRLRISQRRTKIGARNFACMFDYYPDRPSPLLVNFGSRGVTAAALPPGWASGATRGGSQRRTMGIRNWAPWLGRAFGILLAAALLKAVWWDLRLASLLTHLCHTLPTVR